MVRFFLILNFIFLNIFYVAFSCDENFLQEGAKGQEKLLRKEKIKEIASLDELFESFSRGLLPGLKNKNQVRAFELYKKMRFGNPNTDAGTIEKLAKVLGKYPGLTKTPFRNFEISMSSKSYPVTEDLVSFLNSHIKNSGQVRNNLFQIDANIGFWKKFLGYRVPEELLVEVVDKAQRKKLSNKHFGEFLDEKFPKELRNEIQDKNIEIKKRAKILYDYLLSLERTPKVSQAIVDLIHTIGYWDPGTKKLLKSPDGLERLNAFRKILSDRDVFAMELGFEGHFQEVLKKFNIAMPTGVESEAGLSRYIQRLEDELIKNAVIEGSQDVRIVRHLSLVESPFRSCLGGSDCSSRTYFSKALDPNYHYFTIANEEGFSSGHITIVLGSADGKKIAFVDKVQHVDHADLPVMMEAVRKSVKEQGYVLALPLDLGDENGISNEEVTRSFIKRDIKVEGDEICGFTPHPNEYDFKGKHSRAYDKFPVKKIRELKASMDLNIDPGELHDSWKVESIDLEEIARSSYDLKNGSLEERMRYIPSMTVVKKSNLSVDPEFESILEAWSTDTDMPFKLKKQVSIYLWLEEKVGLLDIVQSFSGSDRINFIQSLMDTPRYKKKILEKKKLLPLLSIEARSSTSLSEKLLDFIEGEIYLNALPRLKEMNDEDARLFGRIVLAKNMLGDENFSDTFSILNFKNIDIHKKKKLVTKFIKNIKRDFDFSKNISLFLGSESQAGKEFVNFLFSRDISLEIEVASIFHVYQEVYEIKKGTELSSYEAFEKWIKDNKYTSAQEVSEESLILTGSTLKFGRKAFNGDKSVKVIIPESVTSIGGYAFFGNQLTSVEIPGSVTIIGESAFENNQLTSVEIPGSVTSIGAEAFRNNKLTSVEISEGVRSIGEAAFKNNQLTSVKIPRSVTSIGNEAFLDNQLTSVEIPGSVTNIGDGAFSNNKLTSVEIAEGVTSIGYQAFAGNPLESITIGSNVELEGEHVFSDIYNANLKKAGTYKLSKDTDAWFYAGKK